MRKGPNLTTSYVKYLIQRYKDLFMYLLITRSTFALHSICSTVTHKTIWWPEMFVDKVRSTVYHRNILYGFTIRINIIKADLPVHFTIFHCRMNTIQPAWPVCTTSECWHTCCWHFSSCSSHKAIPFLRELVVTHLLVLGCFVTALSTGITQALIMIAWVGWKSSI